MNSKSLIGLAAAAVVLGGAAVLLNNGSKQSAPRLSGKAIVPALKLADVARVEIGDRLKLAATESGWQVESLNGYPADGNKIAENLLRLTEQKVGQVVRGRKLGKETEVVLKDAAGKTLAAVKLGDRHRGRYVGFEGETVLVKDSLDAFDGDAKQWCNTRIASVPSADVTGVSFAHGGETVALEKGTNSTWVLKGLKANEELDTSKTYSLDSALSYLDFNTVADPKLTEAELGFATGFVYTVTVKEGSNTVSHVATVGNKVKDGSDRYFKYDGGKWIYTISSYSAENMMKTRKDLVKVKEEPKKEPKKESKETKK